MFHKVRFWSQTRWRSWSSVIRIVPQAGPVVTVAAVLNLVIGLLPLGFVVATSVAIDRVPALGHSTHDAWGPVLAAMTVAIVMLLLQSALSPFQAAFTELISRRVDGFCTRRLMQCTLAKAPVSQLERADVLDKLSDARRGLVDYFVTPGAAAAGLVTLIARYAQLLGAVVIVGIVLGPLAAFLIAAAALVARFGNRGSLSRWSVIIDRLSAARRKMFYIFDTGSELAAAKEIRVLGTLPWWRARAEQESDDYLRPMWRERRRIFLGPFIWFSRPCWRRGRGARPAAEPAGHGGLSVLDLSLRSRRSSLRSGSACSFPRPTCRRSTACWPTTPSLTSNAPRHRGGPAADRPRAGAEPAPVSDPVRAGELRLPRQRPPGARQDRP